MFKKPYEHNGNLYLIIREMPLHNFTRKDGSIIPEVFNGWKEYLGAEHVLKTKTHFLFCEKVQDVEWEDVPK